MNKILLLVVLLASTFCLGRAADQSAVETKIERALYRSDALLLEEARIELEAALQRSGESPELLYYRGFARYVQACFSYAQKDKKAVERGLEEAEALLKEVKRQPWKAEAAALRGLIAGQLIGVRGGPSAMMLGPKMMKLTSAAVADAPESGRALMFHGVTLLNTPKPFGGDPVEAVRLFERAISSCRRASSDSSPRWGHAHALAWLAQAWMKQGDLDRATEAANKALELEPEYQHVRDVLLPAIEKKRQTSVR